MSVKPQNVMGEDWRYLIILDACRYDYFQELYADYLPKGRLERRQSIGTNTLQWYNRTFTGYYDDIVVVSGNPFCNSMIPQNGFNANNHFWKVVDAWNAGWDKDLQVVHPKNVTSSFIRHHSIYPDKRFVIHYCQPHSPYVSVDDKYKPNMIQKKPSESSRSLRNRINHYLKWLRIPHSILWWVTKIIGSDSHTAKLYHDRGWDGFRSAYRRNLLFVLPYVEKLIDSIRMVDPDGKIVISADHGERLGEYGMFGHGGPRDRYVCNVPWYEAGI